jgi:hypothetical protein
MSEAEVLAKRTPSERAFLVRRTTVIISVYGAKERQVRRYQDREKTGDCKVQNKVGEDSLLQSGQDV